MKATTTLIITIIIIIPIANPMPAFAGINSSTDFAKGT